MNTLPGRSRKGKKKQMENIKEKPKGMEKSCTSTNILTAVPERQKNQNLRNFEIIEDILEIHFPEFRKEESPQMVKRTFFLLFHMQ